MPNIASRPRLVTPDGRSVLYDLFCTEKAAEIEMRAPPSIGLEQWLEKIRMMPAEAARALDVMPARALDRTLPVGTRTTSMYRERSIGWMPS
jgi:hypothetical protein